jgi:hypothetical protein
MKVNFGVAVYSAVYHIMKRSAVIVIAECHKPPEQ